VLPKLLLSGLAGINLRCRDRDLFGNIALANGYVNLLTCSLDVMYYTLRCFLVAAPFVSGEAMKKNAITATPQQIEATFAEWIRRYRAHPELFIAPDETLLNGTPELTSSLAAPYFIQLLGELQGKPSALSKTHSYPANSLFITVPDVELPNGIIVPSFRVGQYHCAMVDGKAVVSRELKPVVNINFHDSRLLCQASCFNMLADMQFIAIAHDISRQGINWTGGTVGIGKLFQGLHKGTVNGVQTGLYVSPDPAERRWHELSNGARIWDFSGHLYSWSYDDVQGNDHGLVAGKFKRNSISLLAPYPALQCGVGWFPKPSDDWTGFGLMRGGCWRSDGNAGIFNLFRDYPNMGYDYVGVRCTCP
jgi:hypothetical protein